MRRRAKAINFGIIYGISAFGLANQLGIPRDEAGEYIKTYFERFPGIRDYMEAGQEDRPRAGLRETLFGRRIHYPDINAQNPGMRGFAERASINAPIQGTAADIIRRRWSACRRRCAKPAWARMLLQVHDELVFEAPRPRRNAVPRAGRDGRAPEPAVTLSVPLHVDAKAAENWEAAH